MPAPGETEPESESSSDKRPDRSGSAAARAKAKPPGRKAKGEKPRRVRPRSKARSSAERRRPALRLGRLGRGEGIALAAAIILFASTFFPWFGSEVSGQAGRIVFEGAGAGGSAWSSLQWIPLVLMLTIVVAVGAAGLRLAGSEWRPAIAPGAAIAVLGGISTLLVLYRILVPPDFGTLGGISVEGTLRLGVFVGLVAAAGIAYGGYRAMGEEGASFAAVAERLSPSR